jgi:histidinol-phosphate aminotransferase
MKLPLNANLAGLPVYQPGRPIGEVARELGRPADDIIKIASNENPLGPSPMAMEAMRDAVSRVHLYPDGNAFYLKARLARHLNVAPEHLLLGNGSNELIEFCGHALLGPHTSVVVSQFCFAVYPIVTHLFGARLITVSARHYAHDLDAMAKAITTDTRIIFVANPNNPTGTLASRDDVSLLIERVPQDVLLVMDEAYIDFQTAPIDLLPRIRSGERPNLLLLRTFSKIHGLAGLRLGYAIGHPDLITAFERIRQPFNINLMAQSAAIAALDDTAHVTRTRANNDAGLSWWTDACRELGVECLPSAANFILANVGNGRRVFEELQQAGVIVRPMAGYQLPEWIRITIGTPAENTRCRDALRQALARHSR